MAKKDSPLVEKVSETISAMKTDGTMATIHKKWFGVDPEPGTSTVKVCRCRRQNNSSNIQGRCFQPATRPSVAAAEQFTRR